ncbi:hypothetical protein [Candidatus Cardinium hertigii]|uniref:Leucine-rich repeat domain-containing protein n=1 Tax=Candidatus Cardinium hertigii TaxID=247481 RepID=A0A3N2QB11_9BACT|nr:hypothetical protein [Candidatus Cardinium hertigii]ROT46993.1 hypothetical protein EDM02_05490 [Candidatus Cardinium hertigii]
MNNYRYTKLTKWLVVAILLASCQSNKQQVGPSTSRCESPLPKKTKLNLDSDASTSKMQEQEEGFDLNKFAAFPELIQKEIIRKLPAKVLLEKLLPRFTAVIQKAYCKGQPYLIQDTISKEDVNLIKKVGITHIRYILPENDNKDENKKKIYNLLNALAKSLLPSLEQIELKNENGSYITEVDLSNKYRCYAEISLLSKVAHLDGVNLTDCHIGRYGVNQLIKSNLNDLRKLDIQNNRIRDANVIANLLKKYTNLERLNLAENGFRFSASDEAEAALGQLSKLKKLKINSGVYDYSEYNLSSEGEDQPFLDEHDIISHNAVFNQVETSSIKTLAQLPNLQWLYITCPFDSVIDDSNLDDLVKLTNLKKLRLCADSIIDYPDNYTNHDRTLIMQLTKLTNLKYLWLDTSGYDIREDKMEALQAALPNVQVINVDHFEDLNEDDYDFSDEDAYDFFKPT